MGLTTITEKKFRKKLKGCGTKNIFINAEKRTKRKAWFLLKK